MNRCGRRRRLSICHTWRERFNGLGAKLDWTHVLFPGERQRVAFARTLLRRPRLVLLYELLQEIDGNYISGACRVTVRSSDGEDSKQFT